MFTITCLFNHKVVELACDHTSVMQVYSIIRMSVAAINIHIYNQGIEMDPETGLTKKERIA